MTIFWSKAKHPCSSMEWLPQELGSLALDEQVGEDYGNEMGYKVKKKKENRYK
jgi:hypothetical protein